jgi:hypothetical protein
MNHCDACGFRFESVPRAEIADRIRQFGRRYREALRTAADDQDRLRRRPAPGVWSPLEYACHVRDVFRVQRDRLSLALQVDEPMFEPMRRDERAVEERYNEQDVSAVVNELGASAEALADAFAALTPPDWVRTGGYVWPRPQIRTMEWIGRNTVHEGEHHLLDIAAGLKAAEDR